MNTPATGDAEIPATSATVEPEIASPDEGINSSASPDPASPPDQASPASVPETEGDNQTVPPAADDQANARKGKPDRVKELLAERNYWRDRVLAGAAAVEAATPAAADAPQTAPTLEQYGFDTEKWAQAFTKYTETHAAKLVKQSLSEVDEQRQVETLQRQFKDREAAFVSHTPDYPETVADPTLREYVTPTISEAIVLSENGPALSYYLATHRDELAGISRLRPVQQAIALGRIETRIESTSAKQVAPPRKPVQQTRAPAPPTPVGGQSPTKDLGAMSVDEYLASRTWR